MLIIYLLSMVALSFFIKEISGPFNIFGYFRNILMRNKYIGTFFYKLLSCPFCLGFHAGYLVYLLQCTNFDIRQFILYGLAGSTIVALSDLIFVKQYE
jgi:hypothetical protein